MESRSEAKNIRFLSFFIEAFSLASIVISTGPSVSSMDMDVPICTIDTVTITAPGTELLFCRWPGQKRSGFIFCGQIKAKFSSDLDFSRFLWRIVLQLPPAYAKIMARRTYVEEFHSTE